MDVCNKQIDACTNEMDICKTNGYMQKQNGQMNKIIIWLQCSRKLETDKMEEKSSQYDYIRQHAI